METHDNIIDALAAAQGEFPEIPKSKTAKIKTRTGGDYSYSYADLADVLSAVRPILSKHRLAVSWLFRGNDRGGDVITQLLFNGSPPLESAIPVYFEREMQSLGSAITYAKRYGLCGLIGVVAEDDDDGAGAGTPTKQESRQREPQQRQHKQQPAKSETKVAGKSPPAENGEKKPLIEQIKDRIQAAVAPAAIVEIMAKSVGKWPDKQQFLEEIFNLCAEENRSRAANGYTYDNAGKQEPWNDDVRKWAFAELTKIMDGLNQPAPETPAEPVDWPARIAAVKKSEELFALISAAAEDGDLTADPDAFRAVCGLLSAKLDQHATEWGDGVTNISRHHLAQRITAVELDRQHKEAMNNG